MNEDLEQRIIKRMAGFLENPTEGEFKLTRQYLNAVAQMNDQVYVYVGLLEGMNLAILRLREGKTDYFLRLRKQIISDGKLADVIPFPDEKNKHPMPKAIEREVIESLDAFVDDPSDDRYAALQEKYHRIGRRMLGMTPYLECLDIVYGIFKKSHQKKEAAK